MRCVAVPDWAERVFRLTVTPTSVTMAPFEMVAFGAGRHGAFRATWRRREGDSLPLQTITTPEMEFRPGGWRTLNDFLDRSGFWVLPTLSPFDTALVRDGTCFEMSVMEGERDHVVYRHAEMEREMSRIVNFLVDESNVFEATPWASWRYRHDGREPAE